MLRCFRVCTTVGQKYRPIIEITSWTRRNYVLCKSMSAMDIVPQEDAAGCTSEVASPAVGETNLLPRSIVPIGFAPVSPGIYRSLYPTHKSYPFLDSLSLRTAICVDGNAARSDLLQYFCSRGIDCLSIETGTNQEPFLAMTDSAVAEVISYATDVKNQPCLIFSVVDKVKLSVVVGCLRKSQGWGYTAILQEIEHFTDNHECLHNIMYVEAFGRN